VIGEPARIWPRQSVWVSSRCGCHQGEGGDVDGEPQRSAPVGKKESSSAGGTALDRHSLRGDHGGRGRRGKGGLWPSCRNSYRLTGDADRRGYSDAVEHAGFGSSPDADRGYTNAVEHAGFGSSPDADRGYTNAVEHAGFGSSPDADRSGHTDRDLSAHRRTHRYPDVRAGHRAHDAPGGQQAGIDTGKQEEPAGAETAGSEFPSYGLGGDCAIAAVLRCAGDRGWLCSPGSGLPRVQ
jgi:hypothetical protein